MRQLYAVAASILLAAPVVQAQCLDTISPFASNNGGSVGGAVFFDMTVTGGVIINSLNTNYGAAVGTPVGMQIYTIPGTYAGNTNSSAAWTLAATDDGSSLSGGNNGITTITLASPLVLTPGSYGVALVAVGSAHRYTNGTGTNGSYSDAFLSLTLGAAQNVPWAATNIANRVWNGSICYNPAAGLYPNFSAAPLSGPVGTQVQFTDSTYTSDPGGIIAWAWDFEDDGTFDSFVQNPSHTYTSEGIYSVRLQAFDTLNGSQSIVKTGYIAIDVVEASFTTVTNGLTVQFNDTSAGSPTSWAWDFDNDGIVDSTLQNPQFTFPSAGAYTVSLTVADAISNDTLTVNLGVGIIPVPDFGSTFTSATLTRGFWFQAPTRFSIVSAQVPDESAHGLQNVAIYRMASAPPAFSATASGGLEFLSVAQPSNASVPCVVSFDAGEYVGVLGACGDATTMRNSYGTPAGPFASSVFGQPTTLTRFITQTNIVTANGTGAYSSESGGALSRVILGVSAAAGLQYGTGSPSPYAAAPSLQTTALPILGQNAELTYTTNDVQVIGIVTAGTGRLNLPTPFGTLLIGSIDFVDVINGGAPLAAGSYTYSFPIPNTPSLNGLGPINWQAASIVIPTGEFALSNASEWWLAN